MLEQNEQIDKSNTDELEYAGFWLRFGASLVDNILILLSYHSGDYFYLWLGVLYGSQR